MALALWRSGRFSLVISDCHMPELNGYELSKSIRKIEEEEKLQHTTIIAWTANALKEEKVKCLEAGMDDLLTKPVDLETLKKMLAKWLDLSASSGGVTSQVKNTCPFDFAVLRKTIREPVKQIEVLNFFSSHVRSDYEKLLEFLKNGDISNIENISHRMKGSSLMVGANDLALICEQIEKKSHDNDLQGAKDESIKLQSVIIQIEIYCNQLELPKS
jgi:PleD family two-component response regulator